MSWLPLPASQHLRQAISCLFNSIFLLRFLRGLSGLAVLQCSLVLAGGPQAVDTTAIPMRQSVCQFDGLSLPERFSVFAAGAYAGRPLDRQIDQSGHMATRIDVTVNHPDTPVIIMLGAYEPTVWNIGWSDRTKIIGVFASGYHRQAIAGLDKAVPTLISTHDNGGACGSYHVDADKVEWLNPLARRLFGRAVDMVYLAKHGAVTIGQAVPSGRIVTSSDTPPESFFDKARPLSGLAGLTDAVRNGSIRQATRHDAEAWLAAVNSAPTHKSDAPPIAGNETSGTTLPSLHNAYVVLKPFTLPAGLYGANAATFFIPVGAPYPTGEQGHSTIYDLNTLRCRGTACIKQVE